MPLQLVLHLIIYLLGALSALTPKIWFARLMSTGGGKHGKTARCPCLWRQSWNAWVISICLQASKNNFQSRKAALFYCSGVGQGGTEHPAPTCPVVRLSTLQKPSPDFHLALPNIAESQRFAFWKFFGVWILGWFRQGSASFRSRPRQGLSTAKTRTVLGCRLCILFWWSGERSSLRNLARTETGGSLAVTDGWVQNLRAYTPHSQDIGLEDLFFGEVWSDIPGCGCDCDFDLVFLIIVTVLSMHSHHVKQRETCEPWRKHVNCGSLWIFFWLKLWVHVSCRRSSQSQCGDRGNLGWIPVMRPIALAPLVLVSSWAVKVAPETAVQALHAQPTSSTSTYTSRWSIQQKHLADVEDMDYFFGMPILAWAVVVTIIAFILYCAGMRLVSSLARRKAEDTDYFLQSPVWSWRNGRQIRSCGRCKKMTTFVPLGATWTEHLGVLKIIPSYRHTACITTGFLRFLITGLHVREVEPTSPNVATALARNPAWLFACGLPDGISLLLPRHGFTDRSFAEICMA